MKSKPSKSARKRDYLALQSLGERLIELTPEQLESMALDERLVDAVTAARSMRSHGALRRQKQLIGKLMRDKDPEPISAALHAFGQQDRVEKQTFREAEAWRDRIATGGREQLSAYFKRLGHRNEDLANDVSALLSAPHEQARREAKRRIFRRIHRDLSQKVQT